MKVHHFIRRLLTALLIIFNSVGEADIVTGPKSRTIMIGASAYFNCSTTLPEEIQWFHFAMGITDRAFVYAYGKIHPPYEGRFEIEKIETDYNLIIPSVKSEDAGKYECQDNRGGGDKKSAQLTVLEQEPICQSSKNIDKIIGSNACGVEPDVLVLTCTIQYRGNEVPILEWRNRGTNEVISKGTSTGFTDNYVTLNLTMTGDPSMDGISYLCQTGILTPDPYSCNVGPIKVLGTSNTSCKPHTIAIIIVVLGCMILCAIVLLWTLVHRRKGSAGNRQYLPSRVTQENTELKPLTDSDKKDVEKLEAENKRLTEKVIELEERFYSTNHSPYTTTSNSAHTIKTKAGNAPVTGIAILESKLFVASMHYPDVEVYDAETFIFERSIENKQFTNILDIASSKEIQSLYVINRQVDQTQCEIIRLSIAGESGKCWTTENDFGRLSTYESNLIVCFSTKRIIIEYSPESEVKNIVRLSPGADFNQLWHAVKLTSKHFLVSHCKPDKQQRLCIVDNHGTVLMSFEELPIKEKSMRRMNIPLCLVWDRDQSLFVADTNNNRVLLLSSNLKTYENVLLKTDHSPVRLCLNEKKDRIFVGVNCLDKKQLTSGNGHILIYNITKKK